MATFRKGAEALAAAAASSGGGRWIPEIRWDDKETKYIQFLDPIDDVTVVLMHPFIAVAYKEDGKAVPKAFISRRDKSLDGPTGYDELIDRFGCKPKERGIALAMELEPRMKQVGTRQVPEGFDIKTRTWENKEGELQEAPAVGLVVQSPSIFYGHLGAHAEVQPIEDVVFSIKRQGKDTNTQYTFIPAGEKIEVTKEILDFIESFNFDGYLEELASEDRMREFISPLPDDFVVDQYLKRSTKATTSSRARRATVNEAEADEAPAEAQPAATSRAQRFSALRASLEG